VQEPSVSTFSVVETVKAELVKCHDAFYVRVVRRREMDITAV
jgi:hypothetical protein